MVFTPIFRTVVCKFGFQPKIRFSPYTAFNLTLSLDLSVNQIQDSVALFVGYPIYDTALNHGVTCSLETFA